MTVTRRSKVADLPEFADPFLESLRGDPPFHAIVERARQIWASIDV